MKFPRRVLIFFVVLMLLNAIRPTKLFAQKNKLPDSSANYTAPVALDSTLLMDSLRYKKIKRIIIRSAIIPGWGQISNRQAWKLPAVAAVIGFPAFLFHYNLKEYKSLKQAYIYKIDTISSNDVLIPQKYQPLSNNSLKFYRDAFRKNVDYSVLVFILGWGLNVVDAAVFANLKDFDVSDKLTMRISPRINPTGMSQMSLFFSFKDRKFIPVTAP